MSYYHYFRTLTSRITYLEVKLFLPLRDLIEKIAPHYFSCAVQFFLQRKKHGGSSRRGPDSDREELVYEGTFAFYISSRFYRLLDLSAKFGV